MAKLALTTFVATQTTQQLKSASQPATMPGSTASGGCRVAPSCAPSTRRRPSLSRPPPCERKRTRSPPTRRRPRPRRAPPAPVAVAEPVVETKELSPEEKTQREIENRAKITKALQAATKARNKEQIQIALATAEKAGGFSRDNVDIIAAVQAFNELNELSDEVRNKLVADMRKSDPMSRFPGRRQPVHRNLCSDDRARHRGKGGKGIFSRRPRGMMGRRCEPAPATGAESVAVTKEL